VYAGKDPLTGREIRFRKTRKTEIEAQIELGKLLDACVPIAGWDVPRQEANLGYIRRTIKPALGIKEVRKVRGPLLDNLYARLQKCGEPPPTSHSSPSPPSSERSEVCNSGPAPLP
jgi:hypothetical protein